MTMRKYGVALALVACVGASAQEAKWTGPFAGVHVGSPELKTTWSDLDDDWGSYTWDGARHGLSYGLNGGYNYQTGPLVIGGEASISLASCKRQKRMADTGSYWSSRVVRTDEIKSILMAKAKVGYAMDNALFYLTAGVSRLSIDHVWAEDMDPDDSWAFETKKSVAVYGAGMAFKVTPKLSANLEYVTCRKAETTGTNPDGYRMLTTDRMAILQGGISYHF